MASWAVAAGTLALAGVSWWQGKQLRDQRKAERAQELAERVYRPLLRDINGWLENPEGRLGGNLRVTVGSEEYRYIWRGVQEQYPHLARRVPKTIRDILDEAEPYFQRLDDNWPHLRQDLEEQRDAVAADVAEKDEEEVKNWSNIRLVAKVGDNPLHGARLTSIAIRDGTLESWLERAVQESPHDGQPKVRLQVSGEEFEHGRTLELVNAMLEPVKGTALYEKVRDDYRHLRRLGKEAKALIERELDDEWS